MALLHKAKRILKGVAKDGDHYRVLLMDNQIFFTVTFSAVSGLAAWATYLNRQKHNRMVEERLEKLSSSIDNLPPERERMNYRACGATFAAGLGLGAFLGYKIGVRRGTVLSKNIVNSSKAVAIDSGSSNSVKKGYFSGLGGTTSSRSSGKGLSSSSTSGTDQTNSSVTNNSNSKKSFYTSFSSLLNRNNDEISSATPSTTTITSTRAGRSSSSSGGFGVSSVSSLTATTSSSSSSSGGSTGIHMNDDTNNRTFATTTKKKRNYFGDF